MTSLAEPLAGSMHLAVPLDSVVQKTVAPVAPRDTGARMATP